MSMNVCLELPKSYSTRTSNHFTITANYNNMIVLSLIDDSKEDILDI